MKRHHHLTKTSLEPHKELQFLAQNVKILWYFCKLLKPVQFFLLREYYYIKVLGYDLIWRYFIVSCELMQQHVSSLRRLLNQEKKYIEIGTITKYDDVIEISFFLMKLYVTQTHMSLYNFKAEIPRDLLKHNVLKAQDDKKVLWYYVIISRSLHYKMEMGLILFAKKLNFPQKKR